MACLESKDYEEARQRLMEDPIVQAMSFGLLSVDIDEIAWDDGTPRSGFMAAANAEYQNRGGTDMAHIGAVAEVLIRLKRS